MARILIVEDEPALREVERDILLDGGYETLEAGDGAEALTRLRESAEPLVVLLDNRLPDMEGGALLREATHDASLARHAYIFASGATTAEYARELRDALQAMRVEVVPKPFDVDRLLDAIVHAQARLAASSRATTKPRSSGGTPAPAPRHET
jgi:CheY-like chemotaxis protein